MTSTPAATPTPVSTSCAYESWNTTTGCWNYRPCAQCLQTKGCMISRMGFCQEIGLATSQHSYTRAFALNLTLPAAKDTMNESMRRVDQEWEFPAFEATYCPADDPTCRLCVQEEFWYRGFRDDSRFCVGANGCVCVLNCEFTSTWNPACGAEYVNPPVLPAPSSETPVAMPVTSVVTDDDCRYVSKNTTTGCSTYRSCRDCLDKPGCRIALDGYCEADDSSDSGARYNYRIAILTGMSLPGANERNSTSLLGIQEWQFPASQASYCPVNDTTCSECVKRHYWLSAGAMDDSRFCVGANDCVCVANCGRDDNAAYCRKSSEGSYESSWDAVSKKLIFFTVFFIAVGLFVICSLVYCCYSCRKSRRAGTASVPLARVVGQGASTPTGDGVGSMYVLVEPSDPPTQSRR